MPRDRTMRRELERLANKGAVRLKDLLRDRPGVCFAAMMFQAGPGGFVGYSSNARREDMIKSLRELADNLERDQEGPGPPFYAAVQKVVDVAREMDSKLQAHLKNESDDEAWMIAMKSYESGRKRFEKIGDEMLAKEDTATEEEARQFAAFWTSAMIQMSAAMLLAVRYAPVDPSRLETVIRGSDEVH